MLNPRLALLADYPFQRLADLLGGPAGPDSIVMSIGEPQHTPPPMVAETLAAHAADWGKYPPAGGTPEFRRAAGDWLTRRFALPQGLVDPDRHIVPVAGTREALYQMAQVVNAGKSGGPAAVLVPNPFYQVYWGAAVMAGAEPVAVAGPDGGIGQPDYASLPESLLRRTALAYLCSPANPQGSVASRDLLARTVELARRYDFVLAVDECYSEIWFDHPPAGALSVCADLGQGLSNVVVFHSLSKRSSVPGLRSGFVAGDETLLAAFGRIRSYGGAATPLPVLAAAAALWRDEAHVERSRALYARKMALAESLLGSRSGFRRPEGGFFLLLDVGDGERAALALWREAKIRVLPGAYLAKEDDHGINPGGRFIRIALVHDLAITERALTRISEIL